MTSTPISLYIDLYDGQVADLEVVANAALAFSSAVRDIAFIVDPSIEVRVELASGTQGSLSLNSLIRLVRGKVSAASLKKLAFGILLYFTLEARDFVTEKIMEVLAGEVVDEKQELATKADLEEFARQLKERPVNPHIQNVYRELERDPAIRGVGATVSTLKRPDQIVPRSQFSVRSGTQLIVEKDFRRRVLKEQAIAVLISPVLVPGTRRWKLRTASGEHGYTIKDKDFINAVLSGRTPIPMVSGIELNVDIETVEEFRDGVWQIVERDVTQVRGLTNPAAQQSLPFLGEPEG